MGDQDIRWLLQPGETLGEHYRIVRPLGRGGMSEVFLAVDLLLDRRVAVKLLRPELSQRVEVDSRFRREARLLSRLNHPNVLTIHAFGETSESSHYIVTEYVDGESLGVRLRRDGPLDGATLAHVILQIGHAVSEAHRCGMVHRDLKPGNVLLTRVAGNPLFVKVVDFGIAKLFGVADAGEGSRGKLTRAGQCIGTPWYMSPEQVLGGAVDGRTDVYSLAVVACELLTKKRPFPETDPQLAARSHLYGIPAMPSALRPEMGLPVGGPIDRILARALEKSPAGRYDSAEEFVQELADALLEWFDGRAAPSGGAGDPAPTARSKDASCGREGGGARSRSPETELPTALIPKGVSVGGDGPLGAGLSGTRDPAVVPGVAAMVVGITVGPQAADLERAEHVECIELVAERIRQAVERHGGTGTGHVLDGQVVLFGLEPGTSAAVERAVDAALEVVGVTAALGSDPAIPFHFCVSGCVGVDVGPLAVGGTNVGRPVYHGEVLTQARRCMAAASPGDVCISHVAYRHVRGIYEHADVESASQAATGAPRLVRAKRSLEKRLQPRAIHGVLAPFVGRDSELRRLRSAFDRVVSSHRSEVVVVTGRAGVGKSRLVAELQRLLEDGRVPATFLVGPCVPEELGSPYEPVLEAIRSCLGLASGTSQEAVRATLRQRIGRPGDERALVDLLTRTTAPVQSLRAAPDTLVDAEAARTALFGAVSRLLHGEAAMQPLVLCVEGLDKATRATQALIGHVTARVTDVPLLVLLVAREEPGEHTDLRFLSDGAAREILPVAPLDEESAGRLIRAWLQRIPELPGWLVRRVYSLAGGIPLVIEEAVHDLVDHGVIDVSEGQWRLDAAAPSELHLPDSVQRLFAERLGRLEPHQRSLLEAAAVAGRSFWPSLLDALVDRRGASDALNDLARRGLVVERGDVTLFGERDYVFAQEQVREALYESVPAGRRRRLHAKIARWVGDQASQLEPSLDALVGHHLRRAGEDGRALPHLLSAAAAASRVHATEEAVRHLEAALDLLVSHPGCVPVADWPRLTGRAALDLLHALLLSGDLHAILRVARDHMETLIDLNAMWAAEASVVVGRAHEYLGRYDQARAAYLGALVLLPKTPEAGTLRLTALTGEAGARSKSGDARGCVEALRKVLARLEPGEGAAWEHAVCRLHRVLGNAETWTGEYESAEASFRTALSLAKRIGAPAEQADALNGLAALHYYRGGLLAAAVAWQEAIAIADRCDLLRHEANLLNNLGEVQCALGSPADAIETLLRAEALNAFVGTDELLCDCCRLLGEAYLAHGDLEKAHRCVTRAVEAAERVGAPYYLGVTNRTAGLVQLRAGRIDGPGGAMEHLRTSLDILRAAGLEAEAAATEELVRQVASSRGEQTHTRGAEEAAATGGTLKEA